MPLPMPNIVMTYLRKLRKELYSLSQILKSKIMLEMRSIVLFVIKNMFTLLRTQNLSETKLVDWKLKSLLLTCFILMQWRSLQMITASSLVVLYLILQFHFFLIRLLVTFFCPDMVGKVKNIQELIRTSKNNEETTRFKFDLYNGRYTVKNKSVRPNYNSLLN